MLVQGQIILIAPPDYSDQWGNQYQTITVQTAQGNIEGRKASKTAYTQDDIGKQVSWLSEQATNKRGAYNKFTTPPDPRYSQQNPPQNQQQGVQEPAQATKASQTQSNASTWKQLDRELVEKDVICALLASRKRPDPKEVKIWTDYIMDGVHPDSKPQGNTNPDYSDDPPRTDEDGRKF